MEASQQKNAEVSNFKFPSLISTIKLENVKGGFDLMDVDTAGKRLFLAADDNHSIEVIDLNMNKPIRSIPGFNQPKWIVYRPEAHRLYVATAGDGKVTVLDDSTFRVVKFFAFKELCNNLRYDNSKNILLVGAGKSYGAIGIINCNTDRIIEAIQLAAYPKQFELDGDRIYANIPSRNMVQVLSLSKHEVIDNWKVSESSDNVPMALDKTNHRLFVGCEPGKLIIFNTITGKSVGVVDIHKDADGIYLNKEGSLIYISCGEGYIDLVKQKVPDSFYLAGSVQTASGAGTSLYSPALQRIFLAVPQQGSESAELRIYDATR